MGKRNKSFVEQQNDALLFNDVIGPIIIKIIIPAVLIIAIIIGVKIVNSIKSAQAAAESKQIAEIQQKVLSEYKETNKEMFGEIEKEWKPEEGVYNIKNKMGIFEIRFSDDNIVAVYFTSNGGVTKTIR